MEQYTSISVGTDFSAGAQAAVRQAIRIAAWNNARIQVVHVLDRHVVDQLQERLSPSATPAAALLSDQAARSWETVAPGIEGARGLALKVVVDDRAAGLSRHAAEVGADLVVLGASSTDTPDLGAGTLTTACVRHAPCDALIVRDRTHAPFRVVLACTDFSETSARAVERAALIAQRDGAALHVLHVYSEPTRAYPGLSVVVKTWFDAALDFGGFARERLAAFVAALQHRMPAITPTLHVTESLGHGRAIAAFAARLNADLVVLGTRGRSNLRDLLLGSTAERVLRDSPCALLAVRPHGPAGPAAAKS